jgi:hypothetical protein
MNMIGMYLLNPSATELEENRRALERELELRRHLRALRATRHTRRRSQLAAFRATVARAFRRDSRPLDRLHPASRDGGC